MLDISEQVRYAEYLRDRKLMPLTLRFGELSLNHPPTQKPFIFQYEADKYEGVLVFGQLLSTLSECPIEQARILEGTSTNQFRSHI